MFKKTKYWLGVCMMIVGMVNLKGVPVSPVKAFHDDVEKLPKRDKRSREWTEWSISEKPKKVSSLKLKMLDAHHVRLTWHRKSAVDGFQIYRRSSGQSSYHLIKTVKKSSFMDENLSEKKRYKYKIVPILRFQKKIYKAPGATIAYRYKKFVSTDHQKYSYSEMIHDMKALAERFPGKIRYGSIGKSEDGREIYDIVLGNANASRKFLVIGAIHAREYMTSLLCMRQVEYYLENYYGELEGESVRQTLSHIAIHFIPMANPDGVTISQSGIGAIRSSSLRKKLMKLSKGSTAIWKANARGVDLNRNYPVEFTKMGKRGSEGFSGKKAGSESETQAIIRQVGRLKSGGLKGVISYHATGSIIFGDYKEEMDTVGMQTTRMYDLARQLSGYASAANYQSGSGGRGNLREYLLYRQELPCITIEIGKQPCPNPIYEFPSVWQSNDVLVLSEARLFL